MASTFRALSRRWFGPRAPSFELRTEAKRWGKPVRRQGYRSLRVAHVIEETPSTKTFVLEPAHPDGTPLLYHAGQHLIVVVDVDGVSHRRCYSFSTSPLSGDPPAITVKRLAGGRVSNVLHDELQAGDTLRVTEPAGSFTLDFAAQAPRRYVLVAGGVGITPLVSLAETILRAEPQSQVTLLFGNRSVEEICFRGRLAALAATFPKSLTVRHVLEQPPLGWDESAGRLDGARVLNLLGSLDADLYLLCGPQAMMESVTAALRGAGVDADRIRSERFTYAATGSREIPTQPRGVLFAASGKVATAQPGQTLLQAANSAGVALPFSCTMGGCGACKVRLKGGSVVMSEPNCLTERERDEGFVLTCCAYAEKDVVIEGY
ncbi:MAG TPA: ferredoxin--NADP reductase [Myxococcota bacterium]|nr:ferredoxin--NADP reductase [Myxococcota bacterium]